MGTPRTPCAGVSLAGRGPAPPGVPQHLPSSCAPGATSTLPRFLLGYGTQGSGPREQHSGTSVPSTPARGGDRREGARRGPAVLGGGAARPCRQPCCAFGGKQRHLQACALLARCGGAARLHAPRGSWHTHSRALHTRAAAVHTRTLQQGPAGAPPSHSRISDPHACTLRGTPHAHPLHTRSAAPHTLLAHSHLCPAHTPAAVPQELVLLSPLPCAHTAGSHQCPAHMPGSHKPLLVPHTHSPPARATHQRRTQPSPAHTPHWHKQQDPCTLLARAPRSPRCPHGPGAGVRCSHQCPAHPSHLHEHRAHIHVPSPCTFSLHPLPHTQPTPPAPAPLRRLWERAWCHTPAPSAGSCRGPKLSLIHI